MPDSPSFELLFAACQNAHSPRSFCLLTPYPGHYETSPSPSRPRGRRFALSVIKSVTYVIPCTDAQTPAYDLILRDGKVVDGTGNPWFTGDVAVNGDRIAAIGRSIAGSGKREIDARGLIIAPGFIDMHSHSDFTLFEDGNAESKIRQGVTTDVLGEGASGGPNTGKLPPKRVKVSGKTVEIKTLGDYLKAVEDSRISINVASYVGIGNVWESVMGYAFDRPTPEQIEQMKELVAEAMRDGAFGLSTQLMMPPGSLATTDDIVALCEPVRKYGGLYSSHIRNEGTGVFDSVAEAIAVGERAGIPVDVIHLKIADQRSWGLMRGVLDMIEKARSARRERAGQCLSLHARQQQSGKHRSTLGP